MAKTSNTITVTENRTLRDMVKQVTQREFNMGYFDIDVHFITMVTEASPDNTFNFLHGLQNLTHTLEQLPTQLVDLFEKITNATMAVETARGLLAGEVPRIFTSQVRKQHARKQEQALKYNVNINLPLSTNLKDNLDSRRRMFRKQAKEKDINGFPYTYSDYVRMAHRLVLLHTPATISRMNAVVEQFQRQQMQQTAEEDRITQEEFDAILQDAEPRDQVLNRLRNTKQVIEEVSYTIERELEKITELFPFDNAVEE